MLLLGDILDTEETACYKHKYCVKFTTTVMLTLFVKLANMFSWNLMGDKYVFKVTRHLQQRAKLHVDIWRWLKGPFHILNVIFPTCIGK